MYYIFVNIQFLPSKELLAESNCINMLGGMEYRANVWAGQTHVLYSLRILAKYLYQKESSITV